MCYNIFKKKKTIILLEASDKCKNSKCRTPQECEDNSLNHKKMAKPTQKREKSDLAMS